MTRKRCARRPVPAMPRWLRPRLADDQLRDLELVHLVNLDAIARGDADEATLWQVVGGMLTWSRVATLLGGLGADDMHAQLDLATRLVQRYGRTGRIVFTGPEYQLAKHGVDVMDQLARTVDRATAVEAADWSEARVQAMANAPAPAHLFPTAPVITEADVPY
jgi:hypothetical protein